MRRRPGVVALVLVLLALVVVTVLAVPVPRPAPPVVTGVMPGSFTGYAFDTCEAPSQRQMDAWHGSSPYAAVGIYISGENRACPRQRHLDAAWVATQAARGWRLLPLSVGPQAPCSEGTRWSRVDPSPANRYAAARGQGHDVATDAAGTARDLGIARGSTLWLDVESFDTSRPGCRDATLAYVSSWTGALRKVGYASGFYSSGSTGIRMLEQARVAARGTYDLPDQIWVGDWNQRHDSGSVHVARDGWPHGRVHQYSGNHPETYGGVTLRVDSSFMDVGHGTVARADGTRCPRDVGDPMLREGDRSPSVPVLQCLLGQRHLLRSDTPEVLLLDRTGRHGTPAVIRAAGDRGCRPAHLGGAAECRLASLAEVRVCRRRRTAPAARPRRGGKPGRLRHRGVRGAHPRRGGALPTRPATADVWRLLQAGR